MDRFSQKVEVVWLFLNDKPSSLLKKVTTFRSSRYQKTSLCLLCWIPRNASLMDPGSKKIHSCMIFHAKKLLFSQNNRLNFFVQGFFQPARNGRTPFDKTRMGNASYIGNFSYRKSQRSQKILIFPDFHTLCSPNLLAAFLSSSYESACFYS